MIGELSWYGDIIIVKLKGQLDLDFVGHFKMQALESLTRNKVIFSFEELNFVGGNGIIRFLNAIETVIDSNPYGVVICDAGYEYKLLFEQKNKEKFAITETLDEAKRLFSLNSVQGFNFK